MNVQDPWRPLDICHVAEMGLAYLGLSTLGMIGLAILAAVAASRADKSSGELLGAFAFSQAHIPLHDRWKLRQTLRITKALVPIATFNFVWEVHSPPVSFRLGRGGRRRCRR